jgi:hypothetical protein
MSFEMHENDRPNYKRAMLLKWNLTQVVNSLKAL